MVEILKKQWFVVLIALILISFAIFSIWDTNKGKLPGKSVDGKELVAAAADVNVSADDVFQYGMEFTGTELLFAKFQDAVAMEAVDTTDDIKSEAKLQAEQIEAGFKQNYPTNYTTQLQTQLEKIGYSDLNDYCLKNTKVSKLQTTYMDAHMEELFKPIYEAKNSRVVAHILIKMSDSANPTEDELAKVKAVEDALATGTSFADVAKANSDDSSASLGGMLGYMDSDTAFVTEFKDAALALGKDEVSDWVKVASSNYQGWHKIIVLDTDMNGIINYEDDNNTVKNGIYSAIMNNNKNLDKTIIWEAAKSLNVTFANDDIKKQLMDYMGISE